MRLALVPWLLVAGCAQRAAPVVDLPVRAGVDETAPAAAVKPAAAKPAATAKAAEAPQVPAARQPGAQAQPGMQAKPAGRPVPAQPDASGAGAEKSAAASEAAQGEWPPEFYTVKKGDTLYSIALDHGQGYRDVAAWNGLADPNVIKIDQQLRVRPPPDWKEPVEEEGVVARGLEPPPPIEARTLDPAPLKRGPKAVKLPYSDQALAQLRGARYKPSADLAPRAPRADPTPAAQQADAAPSPQAASATPAGNAALAPPGAAPKAAASAQPAPGKPGPAADAALSWAWPARGPLLHGFDRGPNPKGIAIGGEPGQPVLASAPGKVVYSGSGLRGYGRLIIIKHDPTYLSVYAHNRELLVKEGERVGKGQKIAEMGSSEAQRPELHFEIRKLGKPVDPLQYLPPQGG